MTTAAPQRPAGEELAAARLYGTYGRQLYRFCLSRLRSREEAEDAVQNTFLRVYAALRKGAVPQYEAAWLYKIAHNVCLSRREALGRRALLEQLDSFDDPTREPRAAELRRDELHALTAAVEALPENLRRAILLREWQGLSYTEIAEELGTTVSAVETLLVRARRALAAELESRGTGRRLLDLSALLAGLRSLVGRVGDAVPGQLAAGVAVVAVGGAGFGLAVGADRPRPATATTAPAPAPHAVRPAATRAPAAAPVSRPRLAPAQAKTARTSAAPAPVAVVRPAAPAPAAPTVDATDPRPAPSTPPAPQPPVATAPSPPAAPTPTVVETAPVALPPLAAPTLPAVPDVQAPAVTAPDLPVSVPALPALPPLP